MMQDVRAVLVRPPVDPATWAQVERVLRESFPAEELGDVDAVRAEVDAGSRRLWVSDPLAAVAVTYELGTPARDVLLEYLAVDATARSRGIGAALLRDVMARAEGPMILEVEVPDVVRTADASRRIAFYERLGGAVVEGARGYAMPNLAGEGVVPMWLMEMDPQRAAELHGPVLREVVTAIWIRAYAQDGSDPAFRRVVESMT